eukprot:2221303-Pleurochrysis_carterae.AAC.3
MRIASPFHANRLSFSCESPLLLTRIASPRHVLSLCCSHESLFPLPFAAARSSRASLPDLAAHPQASVCLLSGHCAGGQLGHEMA